MKPGPFTPNFINWAASSSRTAASSAAGGEGLALAVVVELHGVLDAVGNAFFPAEHLADRNLESFAGGVVGLLQAAEASRPDADPVGGRGFDGAVDDSAQFALGEAGDRLLLAGRDRALGELDELLELRIQEKILAVDVAWHGEFSGLEVERLKG